jgi:integrase
VTTGLRTEELRALRWKEVDLDAGTVAVYRAVRATADTKTPRSQHVLSLPQLAVRAIREHLDRQSEDRLLAGVLWEDHDLVFASAVGTSLDRHSVLREFRKITQAAGLGTDWVPREMRHTFVSSTSCSNGTALEDIADLVGHRARQRPRRSTGRSSCRTAARCRGYGPALHLTAIASPRRERCSSFSQAPDLLRATPRSTVARGVAPRGNLVRNPEIAPRR